MKKVFNTIGWCHPEKHFMADVSKKLEQIIQMVEVGAYFTINRPHQYGKTSMLETLTRQLNQSKEWLVFNITFEGLEQEVFENAQLFSSIFLEMMEFQMIETNEDKLALFLNQQASKVRILRDLSKAITALAHISNRKMVLLIDEVDSSSNHELFLKFLGMLRSKYLKRHLKTEKTFHSVVLVGVHDIKTLKLKIRPNTIHIPYNSPWNIAANFEVDMNLKVAEIVPMLKEYATERKVQLNAQQCAEKLFYYTSGYPFLVSALCKILDEKILPIHQKNNWTIQDIDQAARLLITNKRGNTNFDHLIKNLENYPELYQLVFDILVKKEHYDYTIQNPTINLGVLYGLFDYEVGNGLKIHNRIYSELIFNYMTSKVKMLINMNDYSNQDDYLLPQHQLNLPKVLDRFQKFMMEQKSEKDQKFLERNGKLLFLGFLQPIINGKGYAFKETQISNEKKMDVVITYYQYQYIVELKIWRGPKKHKEGLRQLADYLQRQQMEKGYLLIFDFRKTAKSQEKKWVQAKNKKIYAVWV